jgi:cystathionine gamma-synthase/methionine-gamma-lyase
MGTSIFTEAVHAGERTRPPEFTPVVTPIYHSVCYLYDTMEDLDNVFGGGKPGYVYARFANPTTTAWEKAVAALEGADEAVAFASGMAAIHAACLAAGARNGGRLLAAQDLYGATVSLLARFMTTLGVQTHFLDVTDLEAVERELREWRPAALICEAISNPLLKVADIPALARLAHAHGAQLIVDSTFATPYLMRPLELGADYVMHSATKYLSGHGDVLGGVVAGSRERMKELRELLKLLGANLGPDEAYLALRGLKTFPLRMRQHCANAAAVAQWLAAQPQVEHVYFPGLSDHPQYELARHLFGARGSGGMVAFELREGSREKVFRFFERLKLCLPATTLGDVYSLVMYPAHASHRSLTPTERARARISDGLVRLSVGIEDAEDIIGDLRQALQGL